MSRIKIELASALAGNAVGTRRGHRRQRWIWPNWRSSEASPRDAIVVGARTGSCVVTLMVGELDLARRIGATNSQRAAKHNCDGDQRGWRRAPDERRGHALIMLCLRSALVPSFAAARRLWAPRSPPRPPPPPGGRATICVCCPDRFGRLASSGLLPPARWQPLAGRLRPLVPLAQRAAAETMTCASTAISVPRTRGPTRSAAATTNRWRTTCPASSCLLTKLHVHGFDGLFQAGPIKRKAPVGTAFVWRALRPPATTWRSVSTGLLIDELPGQAAYPCWENSSLYCTVPVF